MPAKKRMDVLDEICGGESSDGSENSEEDDEPPSKKPAGISKVTVEALERAGYKAGPSVMHVPEQKTKEPESWQWGKGEARKTREASPTPEERAHMRQATTSSVESDAANAWKLMKQAEKLREDKKAEKDAKAKRGQLSFREKEKRKRNAGMQSSAKNYVEEEKRIAREAGVYSGFDS